MRPDLEPQLPRSAGTAENMRRLRLDALRRLAEEEWEMPPLPRIGAGMADPGAPTMRRRMLGGFLAGLLAALGFIRAADAASQQGNATAPVYGGPPPPEKKPPPAKPEKPDQSRPPAPVYGGPPPTASN